MKGLFRKFLEFAIGNGIVLILGLLSTPIITRLILKEEMGKFSMFTMITSLITLVVMVGSDQAYIRYFNEEDEGCRGKLIRRSMKVPFIFNLLIAAILIIFYKPLSIYITKGDNVAGTASFILILLLIIHTIFTILSNFSLIHVRMKQKAKTYSVLQIICKITYLIFACLLYLKFKNNFMVLVIATVLSNLAMGLTGIIIERRDWFNFSERKELKTSTKEILSYGTPFIFSMTIIWIFQSIDKISLNAFWGSAQVGIYYGAMQIVNLLNTVQGAFTTFWTPVAFERFSKAPEDTTFFVKINKIVSLVMLILSIGVITFKDLIGYFLGSDYREAIFIFPFLVFMPIMYTISETTVLGINFNKKTKYHIYIAIVSAVANIIGNLILVPSLGAKGAAISTGFAYVIFFAARTYYSNKFYKINFDLKKFAISTIAVYIFAIYASFYRFNITTLVLAVVSFIIVIAMYYDTIKEILNLVSKKFKKNN